ncbi:MAG: VWA domain-containing protein [Planctomycetes bacterium]|nr:VWA domain-containing protein [Planctomycetota bacterium]
MARLNRRHSTLAWLALLWLTFAVGGRGVAVASQDAPHDPLQDEVARLQALAAIPDTEEAARAQRRLVELARGVDAARAEAAVAALGHFGAYGRDALEQVVLQGHGLTARQRALELFLAARQDGDAVRFAALAVAELPFPLRMLALDGVGGDAAALAAIEPLLLDREPRLQTRALRLLTAARRPAAAGFAHSVLEPGTRAPVALQVAAVEALREERSREAIARLIDVAGFAAGEVRQFALKSLRVIERGAVVLAVLPMVAPTAPAARALVAIEVARHFDLSDLPELSAALRATLAHPSSEVRLALLSALADLEDRAALPLLERAVLDADPLVAAGAIAAVSRLRAGDVAWRQRLLQLARTRLPAQRLAAVAALAEGGDAAATHLLLELLDDPEWRMREVAARGLGRIRTAAAIPPLIERVEQDRRRVRHAAVVALRRISGMAFDDSARDWRRWWADQPPTFTPPPLEQVLQLEQRLAENRARGSTRASFYGIPIESDHLALVIDVSGSMGEPGVDQRSKLEVAKDEVEQLVARLEPGSSLNLLFFADAVRRWKPRLARLDQRAIREASGFVRAQRAGGATNLFDALRLALEDPEIDAVYILSDGEPTAGRYVHPAAVRAQVRHLNAAERVRIHAVSIGGQSALLRHLSEDSGGSYAER